MVLIRTRRPRTIRCSSHSCRHPNTSPHVSRGSRPRAAARSRRSRGVSLKGAEDRNSLRCLRALRSCPGSSSARRKFHSRAETSTPSTRQRPRRSSRQLSRKMGRPAPRKRLRRRRRSGSGTGETSQWPHAKGVDCTTVKGRLKYGSNPDSGGDVCDMQKFAAALSLAKPGPKPTM